MKRQHVDFVILEECAELYSRDHANAQSLAGLACCRDSSNRIVVSERECFQAAAFSRLDHPIWWESAVGGGRMSMQVDERRPDRLCAHRA